MPTPISAGTVPWPAELAELYASKGYWLGKSLGSLLYEVADQRPTDIALVDGPTRLSYRDLLARADATATRMAGLGFVSGDRIVVQLPNCAEFVLLTLACLRIGVVPVMALPAHRQHELAYLCAHAEAVALAVPDVLREFDHQEMAHELAPEIESLQHVLVAGADVRDGSIALKGLCSPGSDPVADRARWDSAAPGSRDVAVFLLSGGTTGLPKLIARTHDDYAYNALRSGEVCGFSRDTVYLVSLPASHNFPLACPGLLGTLFVGGRVIMLASPEPGRAFPVIATEGVTHTALVPAVAQRWLAHRRDNATDELDTLEVLQVGGARMPDEIAAQVRPVLGATLQQVFGMAEGLLNYTRLDDPDEVICTTQGRPMSPDDEILVVDENDEPLSDGKTGALLTRGPYTPRGYYRAQEQNARAFTPDGWYRSGDIVRRRTDGNLVVEGRDRDMINRGGEKISAEEVENLVYQLDSVAQVAAIAMPDPELGERVCLYVVPAPGAEPSLEEVRASLQARGVARYKWPERLELVRELLSTKVGKIDKMALREDLAIRLTRSQEGSS